MILTIRVVAPLLIATLVRASGGGGNAPKRGMTILPSPWAINSWLVLSFDPSYAPPQFRTTGSQLPPMLQSKGQGLIIQERGARAAY